VTDARKLEKFLQAELAGTPHLLIFHEGGKLKLLTADTFWIQNLIKAAIREMKL
jgi:hypothetical protein